MTTINEIYNTYQQHPLVVTDSRKIEKDCIFFALKGENFNGNHFVDEALHKGAVSAVIDETEYEVPGKTFLVENVLQTLQQLAHFHRKKLKIPILGITGSNGKTTTKELIAAVLSQKFKIKYTRGNLNNQIGVPLTLLHMDENTEFGIVEMGANHPGEIAELSSIADPDYGIITNIGKAHLEGFGSFEGVKKTKSELYLHVNQKGGTLFYNSDNPILSELTKDLKNTVSFGKADADFTGELVSSPPFVHVKANFPKGVLYLNTNLTGNYNAENIMAAACIGNFFRVDPLNIQKALIEYQPSNNRSQLIQKGELKIVMDAYNANPTSMQASIISFLSGFPDNENTAVILGDMLELGKYSLREHTALLRELQQHSVNRVYLVGPLFSEAAKTFPYETFANVELLCSHLQKNPLRRGAVLIKGSRGIQLEKTLDYL